MQKQPFPVGGWSKRFEDYGGGEGNLRLGDLRIWVGATLAGGPY